MLVLGFEHIQSSSKPHPSAPLVCESTEFLWAGYVDAEPSDVLAAEHLKMLRIALSSLDF